MELFTTPRALYSIDEVRRLTHATGEEIIAAIEAGEIESPMHGVRWEDVVALAYRRWTPRMISTALGSAGEHELREIKVQLPVAQIRVLEGIAEREGRGYRAGWTVSDALEMLLDRMTEDA